MSQGRVAVHHGEWVEFHIPVLIHAVFAFREYTDSLYLFGEVLNHFVELLLQDTHHILLLPKFNGAVAISVIIVYGQPSVHKVGTDAETKERYCQSHNRKQRLELVAHQVAKSDNQIVAEHDLVCLDGSCNIDSGCSLQLVDEGKERDEQHDGESLNIHERCEGSTLDKGLGVAVDEQIGDGNAQYKGNEQDGNVLAPSAEVEVLAMCTMRLADSNLAIALTDVVER